MTAPDATDGSSPAPHRAVRPTGGSVVYRDPWIAVHRDELEYASGATTSYAYVAKADYALVVPRSATGFWLVEEYRHPVGARRLSFPQGGWPVGSPGGDHEELARAELAEETGLTASRWQHLGRMDVAHGMTTQGVQVFLATGLTPGAPRREATEADQVHRHVSDAEFLDLVARGTLVDSGSVAAYGLWLARAGVLPPREG